MNKSIHPLLNVKLSILFFLCLGFCLALVQAQMTLMPPTRNIPTRKGDKQTTSPKATIVITDRDLRKFEINQMMKDNARLRGWAKRLANKTIEDLDSWEYALEYQQYMEDIHKAQSQDLWNEITSDDIINPPVPSQKAQESLEERKKKLELEELKRSQGIKSYTYHSPDEIKAEQERLDKERTYSKEPSKNIPGIWYLSQKGIDNLRKSSNIKVITDEDEIKKYKEEYIKNWEAKNKKKWE